MHTKVSTSNRRGKAKTYVSRPWTTTEEIALCKVWCEAMDNYIVEYKRSGFWEVVFENFKKEMRETIRKYDTVVIKWKNSIRPKVDAFSVVYESVQRMDENGSSDLVLFQNAFVKFQTGYGHPFTMEACWRILKNHPARTTIEVPTYQRRGFPLFLLKGTIVWHGSKRRVMAPQKLCKGARRDLHATQWTKAWA
nr:hypothetical protein [Tanacetum cinerariifolium]